LPLLLCLPLCYFLRQKALFYQYLIVFRKYPVAQPQSHVTFSVSIGLAYALGGVFIFNFLPEHAVLASVIVIIAGMLPNIDSKGGASAREMGGLLAAISPIVLIEFFPGLKAGGIARIALLVVCCYLITRMVVVRALERFTVHRGIFHSIPAAILTFEVVYLLFWDLYWKERLFIAIAALVGFLSHLILDALTNLDLLGRAFGKGERKPAVLKFTGKTLGSTVAMYISVVVLGWFIAIDIYPSLSLYAGVKY
jgi:membrane-bound metal-dependent hydrolase YbcI (DUF457 family)